MSLPLDDTIAALASPPGPSPRGIIRVSGPDVVTVISKLFRSDDEFPRPGSQLPRRYPGQMQLSEVPTPLPGAVYLWPTRRSYTGQPLVEFHTIGAPPLLEATLQELFTHGVRPARAGEFTLRAFLAGRLDLVQAEAVLGVIDAPDHERLERALRQLGGGISGRLSEIRASLIGVLGDLEAGLDFVEEDIEFIPAAEISRRTTAAADELSGLLRSSTPRLESNPRRRVVLAGPPNAGKSTLFNALAGDRRAIVSDVRGTTRDYLCAALEWDGLPVELVDTAGCEHAADAISEAAQAALREQLEAADLVLWCTSPDASTSPPVVIEQTHAIVHVGTKADLIAETEPGLLVSGQSGAGLSELQSAVVAHFRESAAESPILGTTAARCHSSLSAAITSLKSAADAADACAGDEIVAIELRGALHALGEILGTVYTDDILDHIFSNFCIGK